MMISPGPPPRLCIFVGNGVVDADIRESFTHATKPINDCGRHLRTVDIQVPGGGPVLSLDSIHKLCAVG